MDELTREELLKGFPMETEQVWYEGKLPKGRRPYSKDARVVDIGGKPKWVMPAHQMYGKGLPVNPVTHPFKLPRFKKDREESSTPDIINNNIIKTPGINADEHPGRAKQRVVNAIVELCDAIKELTLSA